MSTDLTLPGVTPFDTIRHLTPEGREFWSARELMPHLDYERWERFAEAINRARVSGSNAGHVMTNHIANAAKMVQLGSGAERRVDDYHLSRLACYLIAMVGDPRKKAIAEAQTYFAIKTREAEVLANAPQRPAVMPTHAEALRGWAAEIEAREAAEAKVLELEPKAEFFDELMDADGKYSMNAAAKALGWGRNVMMRELRRSGVLTSQNLPYQRYAHHFKVVPQTFVRGGETFATATTYVLPGGLEFLRRKLSRELVVSE